MKEKIKSFITDYIMSHDDNGLFRQPLIGFSSVSFFIPFTKKVIESNILEGRTKVSHLWAKTYYECNKLINSLAGDLVDYLKDLNINGATIPATHGFDKVNFVAPWSHKSAAVIAGLGELGVHSLLITDKGCAGRLGTVFIDIEIEPEDNKVPDEPRCLYYRDGSCTECVDMCPTKALSIDSLNKKVCYKKLLHTDEIYTDLGKCDSCGKCSLGPCAYYE